MKKEYIEKTIKRLKQKVRVLINKPAFTKDVLDLRKKWKIPSEGIKSQEELANWEHALDSNNQNYFDMFWPEKRSELINLKDLGQLSEYQQQLDAFNNSAPKNAFDRDIKRLLVIHRLSPRWHSALKRYLLLNDPDNLNIFIGIVISKRVDLEFDTETISLEIEADTTLNDVKAVWSQVNDMQSTLRYKEQKKFQPLKQFDRNKKAHVLQESGKSLKAIAEQFSTEEKSYGDEDIAKMIERYKKKVDIN